MDEWLALADASTRTVPYLWVGPNAAGHLKPPGQILSQGNNALWHYTIEMAKEAKMREVDTVGMYNLTMQARSWDGSGYGQRVALVQAMMVCSYFTLFIIYITNDKMGKRRLTQPLLTSQIINWLSRLETT